MSLIQIAARISAVEALRGKTLVGDNVLDSEIDSFSIDADGATRTAEDRPFIAVYTDGSENKDSSALRSLSINGMTEFIFESGITTAMTETDPDTDESVLIGVGIPATDKAFEFYLDIIGRQIADTLVDPANEWSQIFLGMLTGFHGTKRARTSGDSAGVRLAGRQLTIQASLINEPPRGAALVATHPLMLFFAKADTVPALAAEVALMRSSLAGTVTEFDVMRSRYGRTAAEANATGTYDPGHVIRQWEIEP